MVYSPEDTGLKSRNCYVHLKQLFYNYPFCTNEKLLEREVSCL